MGVVGDAHAARLGDPLEARRDIDAVAENIVVVEDDVADMDADAELDPQLRRDVARTLSHRALQLDRAACRIDGAGELDQHAVAGGLDDAAVMRGDAGIDDGLAQHLELRQRALLVTAHQPAVAGNVRLPAPPPIAGPRARSDKKCLLNADLLKHGPSLLRHA